ncbi:flagellar assembly protein A [Campylobacter sp. MIT 97-5078]|uniref:flagellar assembly protein A n=1 Tax=Campylobacter sp. MIT 97-5078 TaxID=1548153 RepID=UPI0005130A9E|nr:flagellar assembly protein A [Campylobacter sp. MIT 97-5078]KGI55819.1 hypothetical protein LR59_10305 [Campylobacter sp. MIT 97-5078]TQR27836.1 hypothetical protein DMB91_02740 [Campylobacter sp. MIT 97-5078]
MSSQILTSFVSKTPVFDYEAYLKKNTLDPQEHSFKVLHFTTFYTESNDSLSIELKSTQLNVFESDSFFINEKLNIYQTYEIAVIQKATPRFKLELKCDEKFINIQAIIKQDTHLEYYDELYEDILQEIYRQMIELNLLIGIRAFALRSLIKDFVEQVSMGICMINDAVIEVARGIEKIDDKPDELIMHFRQILDEKKAHFESEFEKGDLAATLNKGDLVLEYKKVRTGVDGKNIKNQVIKRKVELAKCRPKINERNFEVEENDKIIKYFAKIDGFMQNKDLNFDISNEITSDKKLSLKSSGSIKASEGEEVNINLNMANRFDDGIDSGITVEAQIINLNGSVAGNTIVKANERLNIKGQIHSKAKIYAKHAKIFNLKGFLRAEVAIIDTLERGILEAKTAFVKNAINAKIYAENVYIENLASTNEIHFLNNCFIKECCGDTNKFIVDASDFKQINDALTRGKQKLQELEECEKIYKSLQESYKLIIPNMQNILLSYKSMQDAHQEPPKSFTDKIIRFRNLVNKIKEAEQKLTNKQKIENEVKERIEKINNIINQAKVFNQSGLWSRDYNEIRFAFAEGDVITRAIDAQSDLFKITLHEKKVCFTYKSQEENKEFDALKELEAELIKEFDS